MSNSPSTLESTDFLKHIPPSLPNSNSLYFLSTDSGSDHVLKASFGQFNPHTNSVGQVPEVRKRARI